MSKLNLRSLGRMLAGVVCVAGMMVATGCSQKCCGKGDCQQSAKCTKDCSKGCAKPCDKAAATKCPPNCDKPCCKKA